MSTLLAQNSPRFRYTLDSDILGPFVLKNDPIGWDELGKWEKSSHPYMSDSCPPSRLGKAFSGCQTSTRKPAGRTKVTSCEQWRYP